MAESSNFLQPAIPRFDGYYEHWSMLMENLIRSKEFWDLIETGVVTAPTNATAEQRKIAEESKLRDLKVKNYLFQSIDRSILETILNRETAKDIWDAMRRKYQGSTKVKRAQLQTLRREFEILAMGEDESVNEYFARTLAIANRMTAHGERIEQVMVVEKILRSMHEKFNYVVCSIEESNDVTTLSIDELQSSLLVHEQRMRGQKDYQKDHSDDQALKMSNSGRGGGRSASRGLGRGWQSKESIECFKCHKLGHYRNECPDWEANYAEHREEEEMLLMAYSYTKEDFIKGMWYIDSGCSNHMTGTKEWFFDFDDKFRESVKLGNDSKMTVMGRGNVKLNMDGKIHVITNVYYLPGLSNNLLSVGQLQQRGLTTVFKNNMCQLFHEEKGLILTTKMTFNKMYIVKASMILPNCLQATALEETTLWHQRYAHLSFQGLKTLITKQMVKGLPNLKESGDKCTDCLVGKQHRSSIPKEANWRASKKLELVHSDICGPINPQSNGGNRYFITFIDDFTKKTWIYFLQKKSSAFDVFKKFKSLVENESSCLIQCLRTDRSGEYTSNEFNEFCKSHGVKRQLTTVYTPQQNGVSERKNRTVLNMVRSMISARSVPKKFWPEAAKWATYVMNRCPTHAVKNVTPEEAWSGIKPSVHHFRVFGCLAHAHIPDVHRKKLDNKSIACVFLGVSEESKAYKLYNPIERKIIVSRVVVFEELKGWNWNKQNPVKPTNHVNDVEESDVIDLQNDHETIDEHDDAEQVQNDHIGHHGSNGESSDMSLKSDESEADSDNALPQRLCQRPKRPPGYLKDYVTGIESVDNQDEHLQNLVVAMLSSSEDPSCYEEASKSAGWKKAMDSEMQSIEANDTWELKYGIDYSEVFAPVPLEYHKGAMNQVYKLKKALYGLKQAPRAWQDSNSQLIC
ncbi:copia-type polyprotein [Trifolium pratense]|uniref:Copia-type polyprotein n=1 Tax=Trifolium pratense TaxID=57577 RepID=A0A2K3N9S3_TRIPR|nr:copia-type polyprotein [Trifolium pratense]